MRSAKRFSPLELAVAAYHFGAIQKAFRFFKSLSGHGDATIFLEALGLRQGNWLCLPTHRMPYVS